ncbi:MAG: HD domain-containing protein [Candidatus Uhrbacteria bacterium]
MEAVMPSTVYFDPAMPLEGRMHVVFKELGIEAEIKTAVLLLLANLRDNGPVVYEHYEHSIRVALIVRVIARFLNLNEQIAFYAGLLHDVGKASVDQDVLGKTGSWSQSDALVMEVHPIISWCVLSDLFGFIAEIVVRHHWFQGHSYPARLPEPSRKFSSDDLEEINLYARLLALADTYDAMHRLDKHESHPLTGEEIRDRLLQANPDWSNVINQLYAVGILTTRIFESPVGQSTELTASQ